MKLKLLVILRTGSSLVDHRPDIRRNKYLVAKVRDKPQAHDLFNLVPTTEPTSINNMRKKCFVILCPDYRKKGVQS